MYIHGAVDSNQKIAGNGLVLNIDAAQYRSFPRGGNIVTSGLVLNLDAGNLSSYPKSGTTWFDLSGNGTNGTLVNGPTYNASNQGSLVFDGTDDRVTASNANLIHGTSNWTYSAWVNFNSTPSLGTLFENGSWTNCLLIRYETNNFAIYSMSSLWGRFYWTPSIGVWYKLDFFRNGNTLFFYIDGVSYSSMSFSANISPSANLFIASSQHVAGQCFNGRIATFQVYNRALSGAEITQNYDALKYRYGVIGSTWFDLSGIANNGTLTNGPTLDFNNGGSIVFDGTNDYVDCGSSSLLNFGTGNFTLSAWFRTSTSVRATILSRFDYDSTGTIERGYLIDILSTGKIRGLFATNGSNYRVADSNTSVNTNNYFHVTVTRTNASTINLYINGVFESANTLISGNPSNIDAVTAPFSIARRADYQTPAFTNYLAGNVPSVQIYNRALSATEVLNNFNAVKSRFGYSSVTQDGLQLYLSSIDPVSNTGSGTAWNDISGNGRNFNWVTTPTRGTDTGVPYFTTLSNRCVGPASNSFGITNQFTIFIICKQLTLTANHAFKFYTTGNNRGIAPHLAWGDGNIYFDTSVGRVTVASGGTTAWNVFVFTSDGTTNTVYKNSTSLGSGAVGGNLNLISTTVDLGSSDEYGGNSSLWNARLAAFLVYDRGLSNDEITHNVTALRQAFSI